MKRLQILLTLSMSLMLFTVVKATNFTEFVPSAPKAPESFTALGLDKYWGFSDQTYRPRFNQQIRVLNWGEETGWYDDSLVQWDTDTIPTSRPFTFTSSSTYNIRIVAHYADELCNRTNPPAGPNGEVYAIFRSTGNTPYYYNIVVATPDCEAPAERTLTGTVPAGTYQISIVCSDWAIGSAWW
jgi:hypothetical protein